MPAAVLAERVLTGHPVDAFHVQRLLELLEITDVDVVMATRRGHFDARPSPVGKSDLRRVSTRWSPPRGRADDDVLILTSDGDDFELLGSLAYPRRAARRVRRLSTCMGERHSVAEGVEDPGALGTSMPRCGAAA